MRSGSYNCAAVRRIPVTKEVAITSQLVLTLLLPNCKNMLRLNFLSGLKKLFLTVT